MDRREEQAERKAGPNWWSIMLLPLVFSLFVSAIRESIEFEQQRNDKGPRIEP